MSTFPNFSKKHKSDSIIEPSEFIKYLEKSQGIKFPIIPEHVVLIYQSSLHDYIANKKEFKQNVLLGDALGCKVFISADNKIMVCSKFGIGSAVAAAYMEELIVLGGKKFLNIGAAGSISKFGKVGDLIVCSKAIRDEGPSHHYQKADKYSYPTNDLTNKLKKCLDQKNLVYSEGITWTIDAPYRETKKEAIRYQKEGVLTVEMEAAALFAVAEYRKVEIAAAFVANDLLGELEWTPAFHSDRTSKGLECLFEAVIKIAK